MIEEINCVFRKWVNFLENFPEISEEQQELICQIMVRFENGVPRLQQKEPTLTFLEVSRENNFYEGAACQAMVDFRKLVIAKFPEWFKSPYDWRFSDFITILLSRVQ